MREVRLDEFIEVDPFDGYEAQQQPGIVGYEGYLTANNGPNVNIVTLPSYQMPSLMVSDDYRLAIENHGGDLDRQPKHFFCHRSFIGKTFTGRQNIRYKVDRYGQGKIRIRGRELERAAIFRRVANQWVLAEDVVNNNECDATAHQMLGYTSGQAHVHLERQAFSKAKSSIWKVASKKFDLFPTHYAAYMVSEAYNNLAANRRTATPDVCLGIYHLLWAANGINQGATLGRDRAARHNDLVNFAQEAFNDLSDSIYKIYGRLCACAPDLMNNLAQQLGVNQWARPRRQEAYLSMSCASPAPGGPAGHRTDYSQDANATNGAAVFGWAQHWGAVVIKSGNDTLTYENYARNGEDNANVAGKDRGREYFGLYGPGRTWHDVWKHDGFANAITLHIKKN